MLITSVHRRRIISTVYAATCTLKIGPPPLWQCKTLWINIATGNEKNTMLGVRNRLFMMWSECSWVVATRMASELPNDGIKCRDTPLRPLRRRRDGDEVCRDNILFKDTPRPPGWIIIHNHRLWTIILRQYWCYRWLITHTKWTFVGGFLVLRMTTLRNDYNGYIERWRLFRRQTML